MLGCDQVFGLDGREELIPVDAAAATVTALDAPAALASSTTAMISASFEGGLPGASVMCTFSAMRGSFAGSEVVVQLDPAGAGTASAEYTAPSTVGDDVVRATVGASTLAKTIGVRMPVLLGHDTNLGGGAMPFNAGMLFGTRVVVAVPLSLRYLGLVSANVSADATIRIGVYTSAGALVAETGEVSLGGFRSVYPVTPPQVLQPGNHWIVAEAAGQVMVYGMSTTPGEAYLGNVSVPFADPMPTTLPAGSFPTLRYSLFLIGIAN